MSDFIIGAYVEIDCNEMTVEREYWACPDWHTKISGWYANTVNFCPECGKPIALQAVMESEFPRHIVDDILPEEWEDVLQNITPRSMFGTGKILASWNGDPDVGIYAWLDSNDNSPSITAIPTPEDIERIKREFADGYGGILKALTESPLVRSLEIQFAIIREEEY